MSFYKPTLIIPSIEKAIDARYDNDFVWQLNGDEPPTAFQIFIKKNSDNSLIYDSGKIDNNLYNGAKYLVKTLPCNTLTNGEEYKWMVRLWKNDAEYIDSGWSIFKTNTTPVVDIPLTPLSLPTFSRNSTAYLSDGTLLNTNLPRFETGKFGKAVMIEEGTTNLISNPSFENDFTGWSSWGTPIIAEIVTSLKKYGNKSYHHVSNSLNSGKSQIVSVSPNITYTLSCYIYTISNTSIRIMVNDTGTYYQRGASVLNNWERVTLTFTTKSNTTSIYVYIGGEGEAYFDGIQLEQKSYPTSFIVGTRSSETLTIPTAGVLNPQEGTVECWVYVNDIIKRVDGIPRRIWHIGKETNDITHRLILYHIENNTKWVVLYTGSSGDQSIVVDDSITSIGWHYFAVTWGSFGVRLYIDGVKRGENSATLSGSFSSVFRLGHRGDNTRFANTLFDDLRISNRARTDEEIAAAYASGQPLPVDEWTTYKLGFDDSLTPQPYYKINKQYYTFTANYQQQENVPLQAYKFILYDNNDNLLSQSDWIYESALEYEFGGLESGNWYKIEVLAKAQNGMAVSSGKKEFFVAYDVVSNSLKLNITPLNDIGSIKLDWNIKQVLGEVVGNYAFVTGKFGKGIYLQSGSVLKFEDNLGQDFTVVYYCKLPSNFKGVFAKLGDDFEIGYDGNRFYYKRQNRITAGRSVTLPTDFFVVGIKMNKIIIKTSSYTEVIS